MLLYLIGFVTEEMDFVEVLKVLQAVSLVPTFREDLSHTNGATLSNTKIGYKIVLYFSHFDSYTHVEANLSSNRESKVKMGKPHTKFSHHLWSNVMNLYKTIMFDYIIYNISIRNEKLYSFFIPYHISQTRLFLPGCSCDQ